MPTHARTFVFALLLAPFLFASPAPADDGVTWSGQVVDLACYMAHGVQSPDDDRCAASADADRPKGLLVYDGFLVVLAPASELSSGTLAELPYEWVEITGHVVDRDGVTVLLAESFRRDPGAKTSVPGPHPSELGALAGLDPIRVGPEITPPVKVRDEAPVYPPQAKDARLQGVVIIQALIDHEGNVRHTKVLKGLPLGISEAAVAAVKAWKFEPAKKDGEPVVVLYNLTINFRLS